MTPCGRTTMRNYSLSDKPNKDYFRISVKREGGAAAQTPDGFVSNMLHKEITVGSVLEIGFPCGDFFLDVTEKHERPLVLMAGGIGITPIYAMLKAALEAMPDRKIILVHAVLNEDVQPFKKELDELAAKHSNLSVHYRYSEAENGRLREGAASTGLVDAELIEKLVPDRNADYYFCGPKMFMLGIYHHLLGWGIPASQVHFEFFGPKQELQKSA